MPSSQSPLVMVVSHSHWDREWYKPLETFRYALVNMVETLLDLLDEKPDYRHFMLDGQSVLLEDIVALRPDLEERLTAYIRQGRISIGPWYVLQDEFLVSGESLARNLLIGRKVAARFGRPMNVGYVPDAFGHVSQMPRVLQGFGLQTAALWRGVGDQVDTTEWLWEAPAGARVLTLWLKWDYSGAGWFPEDVDKAHARLRDYLGRVEEDSTAATLVWMNGSDHLWPDAHMPEMLEALRRAEPNVEFCHGSLEQAASRVRDRLDLDSLPVISSELRCPGPEIAFLLPGVLSARSWQQACHDQAEWALTRQAEPFSTLSQGNEQGPLSYAWRTLLKCQPHDSICGCSVDDVHRDLERRIASVDELSLVMTQRALRLMIGDSHANTRDLIGAHPTEGVVLANPHPYPVTAHAGLDVTIETARMPFRLMGPDGEVAYVITRDDPFDPTLAPDGEDRSSNARVKVEPKRNLTLSVLASDLPAHGLQTLRIEPGPADAQLANITTSESTVDNGLVQLRAVAGGLEIVDMQSGARVRHHFEDVADRGDEYNFCPVIGETTKTSHDITWTVQSEADRCGGTLTLQGAWALPGQLSESREQRIGEGGVTLGVTAQLIPGVRGVVVTLDVDNRSMDHRLRAGFSVDGAPDSMLTDGAFDWIRRPAGDPRPVRNSEEDPVATQPMVSMTAVELSGARLGLGSVGLREVELTDDGTLFLTVLRSVGWLSRGDLHNRPRHAGPALATPEAQGLGRHRFRYVLGFDALAQKPAAIHRVLEPLLHPPMAVSTGDVTPTDRPLLSVEPAAIRLAAVKRAEDDGRLIIRLVGADSGEPITTTVSLGGSVRAARLSDLDERAGTPLPLTADGDMSRVTVEIAARDVCTLALEVDA